MLKNNALAHFVKDVFIICASIILAYVLAKSGAVAKLVELDGPFMFVSWLVAGAFFTSIFTVAPAGVALTEMVDGNSMILISAVAALGAMIVDTIIISFVRKDITNDLSSLSDFAFRKHLIGAFHFGFLKWVALILGVFVVASPLPDELGLFLIGLSKVRSSFLPLLFFIANFIGIFALLSIASSF